MRRLKLFFACLLMAVLSIGQVWGGTATETIKMKGFASITATGYQNITKSGTSDENSLGMVAYAYIGSSGQVRGNKTSIAGASVTSADNSKNWSLYNSDAMPGAITAIKVTGSVTGTNKFQNKLFVSLGTSSQGAVTSVDDAQEQDAGATATEINFTIDATKGYTYFKLLSNQAFTSGAVTDVKVEVTYSTGGAPAPTLTAVTVSGAPTKTSYYAGQDFDPAGLTVTGTYSDESTAPITSGITWSYDPSQELALNQTSIGVIATVSEIASPKFNVTGLTVTAATVYELITSTAELEEGAQYIIANTSKNTAMGEQKSTNRIGVAVTINSNKIIPGDDVQIITLGKDNGNWTFYTGSGYLYAASSSDNHLKTQTTNNANGQWTIEIAANGDATITAQGTNTRNLLRCNNNGTPYSCYGSGQQPVHLFKKADGRQAAGLAYAEADKKKLAKLGDAFTAPTLVNPNSLAVTYASNNTDVAEVAANGAVTIKAAGVAVITASFAGNDDYKAGDASYTIGVTSHAGTQADPYVAADVKIVIDAVETLENAYATGVVSNVVTTTLPQDGYITFYFSADGLTSGQQVEAYKCYGLNSAPFEAVTDVVTGATVVVTGTLKKFNSTYEFDQNCHLVSYEAPEVPKTHIANDQANPYTVAQAIAYAADGVTYDLDDYVYVQGVVYDVKSFNEGVMNIFIKDANAENQFELYKCAGINDGNATTPFEALTDVQAGNIVIGYGQLTVFNTTYEFKQGNYLVDLQTPATGVQLDATAEVEVGNNVNLTATILPSNATGTIVWSVESGDAYASVDGGVVTGIAEGEAVIRATVQGTEIFAECTVTVNAGTPVLTDYYEKVTETAGITDGTYLIVYEADGLAFNGGLTTLDAESNTIAVAITNDNKIGVTEATAAATFFIDVTAGSIQAANGKYIGVSSYGNGLKTSETSDYTNAFAIDGDGNAVISIYNATWNKGSEGTMILRYNSASGQTRFRYYKEGGQQPITLYKLANETVKANPELAWDPADDIVLTVGDDFTAPTLTHADGLTETITFSSDKESVATVDANGVISLVADATGTAHITASYPGDANFKAENAVCTIKVNPAHSIYVSPSLTVNFGSVVKDATVDDKVITVTLTEVPAATAALGGDNPEAFSITPASPAALTESGDITISVASTATVGTYNAMLTISDDAGLATTRVVTLKLTVTEPSTEETAVSTSTQWVAAVAADLVDGKEVLITGIKDEVVYAMGEQKSTNRAAYVASVDGDGVLTPGTGTMSFTLVAQETEGVFALRTSNGKYLYAAASGSNHLKTQDEVDVNAKWTLAVNSAVATESTNRNIMRFNGSGENKLFSCYSSGQTEIKFYVPKPVTPPTPVYTEVRSGLEEGRHYTVCLEKNVTAVKGATFWSLTYKNSENTAAYLVEEFAPYVAGKPYIFQATDDNEGKLEVVYEGDAVGAPVENGALRGTFNYMDADALAGVEGTVYMLFNNELRPIGTNNHLDAHRAYVRYDLLQAVNAAPARPGHRVKSMPMQPNTATDIDVLNASEVPVKVLINGQIFILRGEKMYDTTGRLVK